MNFSLIRLEKLHLIHSWWGYKVVQFYEEQFGSTYPNYKYIYSVTLGIYLSDMLTHGK